MPTQPDVTVAIGRSQWQALVDAISRVACAEVRIEMD